MVQEVQVAQISYFTTIDISLILLGVFFIVLLILLFNKSIQKKNKFIFGGIFVLLLILALIFPIKYSPFSETNGKIIDSNGSPIEGAKIEAGYFCSEPRGFVDTGTHHLGSDRAITNSNGEFTLDKFSKLQIAHLSNCQKSISVFKEGYGNGDNLGLGIRALSEEGLSLEQINTQTKRDKSGNLYQPDMFYYLLRTCNGKYYDSISFDKVKQISSKEKQVVIELAKIDLWSQCN